METQLMCDIVAKTSKTFILYVDAVFIVDRNL